MKRNKQGQFVKGMRAYNKGEKMSEEFCRKAKASNHWKGKTGANASQWKGGRVFMNNRLYIFKPEHPRSDSKGYVRNHRLVAEECLGRYLTAKEIIHHIDEDKSNDNPENLYLFSSRSEHCRYHGNQYQRINPEFLANQKELVSNLI